MNCTWNIERIVYNAVPFVHERHVMEFVNWKSHKANDPDEWVADVSHGLAGVETALLVVIASHANSNQ